jgi:hypothetical protein
MKNIAPGPNRETRASRGVFQLSPKPVDNSVHSLSKDRQNPVSARLAMPLPTNEALHKNKIKSISYN